jgi:hypothetical protein
MSNSTSSYWPFLYAPDEIGQIQIKSFCQGMAHNQRWVANTGFNMSYRCSADSRVFRKGLLGNPFRQSDFLYLGDDRAGKFF